MIEIPGVVTQVLTRLRTGFPERTDPQTSPLDAVADAVLVTGYKYLMQEWRGLDNYPYLRSSMTVDQILASATAKQCKYASALCLDFLQAKYGRQFEQLFLLSGADLETQPLVNPNWGEHTYFVAKDRHGIYYAASPANYVANQQVNSFNTVLSATDLNQLLAKIISQSGGAWPRQDEIEAILKANYRRPVRTTKHGQQQFSFTDIGRDIADELNHKYTTYFLNGLIYYFQPPVN